MLDVAADGVDDDRLGQRELVLAVDVEGEDGVGAVVTQHGCELEVGEGEVPGLGAVAVEDGGDLAGATGAACGTLAELGADAGYETILVGHDVTAPTLVALRGRVFSNERIRHVRPGSTLLPSQPRRSR